MRVPARAAIAHPRQARARIEPALEARRHAGIDRWHALAARTGAVDMHAVAARSSEHCGNDALHREGLAVVRCSRGAERRHGEHQEIERTAQELGDDEHQSDD